MITTIEFTTPSFFQNIEIRVNSINCRIEFVYNRYADCWSFTLWKNSNKCPSTTGRFIVEGVDLFRNLNVDHAFLIRQGMQTSSNWLERMMKKEAKIILMNNEELNYIANSNEAVVIC